MRLLDLFCCQGGAAMGYHRAGFEVVGVDIEPQPRYPFEFHQGDAFAYLKDHWHEFEAVHASPPCQAYSRTKRIRGNDHPDLIEPMRNLLKHLDLWYVIENVPGAPLINPITLIGTMFGLLTVRARLFECNFPVPFELAPPAHARHAKMGRPAKPGEFSHVVGHIGKVGMKQEWEQAIGIDWMTCDGLAQAIPPAYTAFIGKHLMQALAVSP